MHCITLGDKIELRRAMKQLKLLTLPQVFIIHLKRFSIDHIITKNSIQVKYPAVIDVKEYCIEVRIQLDAVAKLVKPVKAILLERVLLFSLCSNTTQLVVKL